MKETLTRPDAIFKKAWRSAWRQGRKKAKPLPWKGWLMSPVCKVSL
jgi:hypothetical protein